MEFLETEFCIILKIYYLKSHNIPIIFNHLFLFLIIFNAITDQLAAQQNKSCVNASKLFKYKLNML